MDLKELHTLREILIEEGYSEDVKDIDQLIEETTSAAGGPGGGFVSGGAASMSGAIQSSQPSALPGALKGANWINGGGEEGSGDDINVPYNPSGANRIFQKIPKMGKNHGARTGKKSREKPLDLKHIQSILKGRKDAPEKPGKVMDFDKFNKDRLDDVTKLEK